MIPGPERRHHADGRNRVVEAHRLVRIALVVAAGFGVTSLAWAGIVLVRGGWWWGPVHSFLIGVVLAAISAVSQMFTITWSSAPPPARTVSTLQGVLLVSGAILVLVGVVNGLAPLVWVGGTLVAGALVLLGAILLSVIRRSLLRRFDLSIRFYLLALSCGAVGVTLGLLLGSGAIGESYAVTRLVHSHLNLVGLVGFTILGTVPTLLPTFAHRRAVSGREAVVGWRVCIGSSLLITAGLVGPAWLVGAGTIAAGLAAAMITSVIVVRLGRKGLSETLPYLQVITGVGWLVAWAMVDGWMLIAGTPLESFSGWTAAAVVAGVGQVLAGSVAYLIPVAIGTPITDNLQRMGHWPALPLLLASTTGLFLAMEIPRGATIAGGLWLGDFLRRLATVRRPQKENLARPSGPK